MLSAFDDYPIHQTTHPIARTASADLNHYDRYFFNGYTSDASSYFAVAMGLYPNRHVADASFSVVVDGGTPDARQISVHASGRAPVDRADANVVGPIHVEVIEPMRTLRIDVDAPDQGLRADLRFEYRSPAIEEPHFLQFEGARVLFDYTRLTQFGTWAGWLEVDGDRVEIGPDTLGSRDRSWGIRPVGERGSTGAPVADPQFFWLWAPLNFEKFSTHFDINEYADGERWHGSGFIATVGDDAPEQVIDVDYRLEWKPGTRAAASFEIDLASSADRSSTIRLEPLYDFQMLGLGYNHPEWGHGMWKGELEVGGERWTLPVDDPLSPHHVHIQTVVRATTTGDLGEHEGLGVLEQLVIGRHVPSGLEGLFDGYADS